MRRSVPAIFQEYFLVMIGYVNNDYASQTFPLVSLTSILGDVWVQK